MYMSTKGVKLYQIYNALSKMSGCYLIINLLENRLKLKGKALLLNTAFFGKLAVENHQKVLNPDTTVYRVKAIRCSYQGGTLSCLHGPWPNTTGRICGNFSRWLPGLRPLTSPAGTSSCVLR